MTANHLLFLAFIFLFGSALHAQTVGSELAATPPPNGFSAGQSLRMEWPVYYLVYNETGETLNFPLDSIPGWVVPGVGYEPLYPNESGTRAVLTIPAINQQAWACFDLARFVKITPRQGNDLVVRFVLGNNDEWPWKVIIHNGKVAQCVRDELSGWPAFPSIDPNKGWIPKLWPTCPPGHEADFTEAKESSPSGMPLFFMLKNDTDSPLSWQWTGFQPVGRIYPGDHYTGGEPPISGQLNSVIIPPHGTRLLFLDLSAAVTMDETDDLTLNYLFAGKKWHIHILQGKVVSCLETTDSFPPLINPYLEQPDTASFDGWKARVGGLMLVSGLFYFLSTSRWGRAIVGR
jgi:hypothetical protein